MLCRLTCLFPLQGWKDQQREDEGQHSKRASTKSCAQQHVIPACLLVSVGRVEWQEAADHGEEHHAQGPHVHRRALVQLAAHDLQGGGADIRVSSAATYAEAFDCNLRRGGTSRDGPLLSVRHGISA